MNAQFFQQIEPILAAERLSSYRHDGATPAMALARYLLNTALSEALYPVLQFAEIALRNAIHAELSARAGTADWFDSITLTPWQMQKVHEAKDSLYRAGKPATAGAMVAELVFGFWTGFFNNAHSRTGLGHLLARRCFAHAPRSARNLRDLDASWKQIRDLRNRIFHHERILHWRDLDAQHAAILEMIRWISPELLELTRVVDRFPQVRIAGLLPWQERIKHQ